MYLKVWKNQMKGTFRIYRVENQKNKKTKEIRMLMNRNYVVNTEIFTVSLKKVGFLVPKLQSGII